MEKEMRIGRRKEGQPVGGVFIGGESSLARKDAAEEELGAFSAFLR